MNFTNVCRRLAAGCSCIFTVIASSFLFAACSDGEVRPKAVSIEGANVAVANSATSGSESSAISAVLVPPTGWSNFNFKTLGGKSVDVSGVSTGNAYVLLFKPSENASLEIVSKVAEFIRTNPQRADRLLVFPVDANPKEALKRYLYQAEWARLVNEAQATPSTRKDFNAIKAGKSVKAQLETKAGRANLRKQPLPFTLVESTPKIRRYFKQLLGPRQQTAALLRIDGSGALSKVWSSAPVSVQSALQP